MSVLRQVFVVLGLGMTVATVSSANTVALQDNDFDQSNWAVDILFTNAGSSVTGVQEPAGGNPGAYRNVTNTLWSSTGPQTVYGFHHRRFGFTYNPSTQGAIETASFQIDFKDSGNLSIGQRFEPALQQNGRIYSLLTSIDTSLSTNWITSAQLDLHAEDFGWVNPCTLLRDSTLHPDFSANGSTIDFGFATSNAFTPAIFSSISVQACYDNLLWTICPDPCRNPPPGDLNGDCRFDLLDFALMMPHWLTCGLEPASLCD